VSPDGLKMHAPMHMNVEPLMAYLCTDLDGFVFNRHDGLLTP
jgi:hypothetical protein